MALLSRRFPTSSGWQQLAVALHRKPPGRRGGKCMASAHYFSRSGGCRSQFEKRAWRRPLTSLTLPFKSRTQTFNPALPSCTPIEISRVMLPDDTNPLGFVHGGNILKMLEQAGHVVSSRHCNWSRRAEDPPITTILVRLEKMDFHQSMHVGEVAQLQAAVTYTAEHSLEVTVDVWAENVLSGQQRYTNTATLWYVAIASVPETAVKKGVEYGHDHLRSLVTSVPQMKGLSKEELEAGKRRYDKQKASRMNSRNGAGRGDNPSGGVPAHVYHYPVEVGVGSVLASQTTLANIVLPSDCTVTGHMTGGALMKMMDNAALICASRHSHGRTVTACIDVINFHQAITNGEIVFVTARMVFTSSKSMEIEVTTEAEGHAPVGRRITNTAYFTFVSVNKDCCAQPVPLLQCTGEEEEARFEEGKQRYMARKEARMEANKKT